MAESASQLYSSPGMISSIMPSSGVTARENMIFQEYLSNTAHQREMADLKAAGLNPWLASNSGAQAMSGSTDSADVLAMLNGSARNGASNVENGFKWADFFGSLGLRKNQAQALGNVADATFLSVDQAAAILRENDYKVIPSIYQMVNESKVGQGVKRWAYNVISWIRDRVPESWSAKSYGEWDVNDWTR